MPRSRCSLRAPLPTPRPWSKFILSKELFWGFGQAHTGAAAGTQVCKATGKSVPGGGARSALGQAWANPAHTRVHTTGSTRVGSRRAGGREPVRRVAPRRAALHREPPARLGTKNAAGRGRSGGAVIGGWGLGLAVDWPRPQRAPRAGPAPSGRNPSPEPRPGTCPRPRHLRRGRGTDRSRVPTQHPLTRPAAAETGNLCTQLPPSPPPAQVRSGSFGARAGRPEGQGSRARVGQGCPDGKGLGPRKLTGRRVREQGTLREDGLGVKEPRPAGQVRVGG